MTKSKGFNPKEFVCKYWQYIVAFFVPVIIVLIHCITRDVWLFGNGSMLRGELGTRYIYIFEELWNKVHSGELSFFSWNAVGGYDFYLNMLYYTMSPFTLIILLLPKACMEDALQMIMVIKWALLAFSAVYFFMHTQFNTLRKNKRLVVFTLGLCYALSSFFVYMLTFVNWLDTMIIFPFLLLLVERMVEKKSWKLYFMLLVVAMCCNCYIAFPVCIFLLLWFLLQLQAVKKPAGKVFVTFLLSSVGAAVGSAVVILPGVLNLEGGFVSAYVTNPGEDANLLVESPHKLIGKFFAMSMPKDMTNEGLYLYMSIGVVVLGMMFVFIRINMREKYTKIGMVIFIAASCLIGALNYMWTGFLIPQGYNPRFGFLLIFIICIMALDVITHIKQLKVWNCLLMLVVCIGLFCFNFFQIKVYEEFYIYLINIMLLVFSFILLILLCRKSIKRKSFIIVFCTLCIVEVCGNAYFQLSQYDVSKPAEIYNMKDIEELTDGIRLEAGQRVIYAESGYNAGMNTGIATMSGAVSYIDGTFGAMLCDLGVDISSEKGCIYSGGTPLMNTIFNIGYGIGAYETEISDATLILEGETDDIEEHDEMEEHDENGHTHEHEEENKNLNVYQANRTLGLGYMVDNAIVDWNSDGVLMFEKQNRFVKLATNRAEAQLFTTFIPDDLECFTSMGYVKFEKNAEEENYKVYEYIALGEEDGSILSFKAEKDMDLYLSLACSTEMSVKIAIDDEIVYQNEENPKQVILSVGKVKKGQEISVMNGVKGQRGNTIQVKAQFAEFDAELWQIIHNELSDDVYQITEMKDDYINGKIKVEEDGIMMTSIPAMKGFDAYVDGELVAYEAIGNALIGIPLEIGEHIVEFRYRTPYAKLGWMISLIGISIYLTLCMIGRKKDASIFCETGTAE